MAENSMLMWLLSVCFSAGLIESRFGFWRLSGSCYGHVEFERQCV